MAKRGKRVSGAYDGLDRDTHYPLAEAVRMIKDRASARFAETLALSMNLGVDPRHADQMVRGVV